MSFVCLWIPNWPTAAGSSASKAGNTDLPAALLAVAPHVVTQARGVIWVDARGLDASTIARRALDLAGRYSATTPRAGVANTAIAAEVAAIQGHAPLVTVPAGADVTFLAPFPLAVLAPSPRLEAAFADVGLETCGDLTRLTQAAVEVRFGSEGAVLWRLARAEDPRQIFSPAPRALPSASLAWEEYVLRDPEQLVFAANRLVATICAELRAWGEATQALILEFTLANGAAVACPLRAARETSSRTVWMRLVRRELDRLQLDDGVTGLAIRIDVAGAAGAAGTWPGAPRLLLQLFPELQRITVTTTPNRGRRVPARFRTPEGHVTELLTALGPDHVSAAADTSGLYAREYFTCLTDNGLLVLLFRDALTDSWYLQGWLD